jgi:hypothetical protein
VAARGRQLTSPENEFNFWSEVGEDHTLAAKLSIHPSPGEQVASKSNKELLDWWLEQFERFVRSAPGREGAVLRSFDRVEATREPPPAQGAECAEIAWAREDRRVPGHKGEPFIGHDRDYGCVHPVTHGFVRVGLSERFPADRAQLRPGFEEDASFLFDSLRLE